MVIDYCGVKNGSAGNNGEVHLMLNLELPCIDDRPLDVVKGKLQLNGIRERLYVRWKGLIYL
jgi:hypothetical protein